jgi:hypothetical protein
VIWRNKFGQIFPKVASNFPSLPIDLDFFNIPSSRREGPEASRSSPAFPLIAHLGSFQGNITDLTVY